MSKVFESFDTARDYVAEQLEDFPDDYNLTQVTLDLLSLDSYGNFYFTDDVERFFQVDKLWKSLR